MVTTKGLLSVSQKKVLATLESRPQVDVTKHRWPQAEEQTVPLWLGGKDFACHVDEMTDVQSERARHMPSEGRGLADKFVRDQEAIIRETSHF